MCIPPAAQLVHGGRARLLAWSGGIALVLASLVGCDDGRPARRQVTGSVTVDGRPAAGAIVVLHPVAGSVAAEVAQIRPAATCGRDGSFVVGSWELADGVPVGRWRATVQWFVAETASAEADPESAHLDKDRLGGAYADPETTPLMIDVADSTVTLPPFELRSAPTVGP